MFYSFCVQKVFLLLCLLFITIAHCQLENDEENLEVAESANPQYGGYGRGKIYVKNRSKWTRRKTHLIMLFKIQNLKFTSVYEAYHLIEKPFSSSIHHYMSEC